MSREIDRQIAELMGYNVIVSDIYDYWYYSEKYKGEVPIPPFSISWEAMRLLVEWLQGMESHVEFYTSAERGISKWNVVIALGDYAYEARSVETAPLALCKAVLSLDPEVLK